MTNTEKLVVVKPLLVSIESPFNAKYPWLIKRNIQYAILANTHAASLGEVTWTPHIVNTQYVKFGTNGYISDTLAELFMTKIDRKYFLGRDETLRLTNLIRQNKMDKVVCYTDYGISSGMKGAIDAAKQVGVQVEYRQLPPDMKREIFGESILSTVIPIAKNFSITATALTFFGLYRFGRFIRK
jgi:hypothetical protein